MLFPIIKKCAVVYNEKMLELALLKKMTVGLIFLLAVVLDLVNGNWMYLSMASIGVNSPQPQAVDQCSMVPDLVLHQQRMCQTNPQAMPCVGLGAQLGFYECRYQFLFERWNCTSNLLKLGQSTVLKRGTKEKAFVYAITSAGVVHAITKSCSAGNLTDCSCDMSRQGQKTKEGWQWGGCSDNVDYGTWFARTFIDAPDRIKTTNGKDVRALMNLHNNEVGRQAVQQGMVLKCRCHGVSGSCAVKTCWNTMPSFRMIGDMLKQKYSKSKELPPKSRHFLLKKQNKRRRRKANTQSELVYVDKSPDYCRRNEKRGITGTRGRECKMDTNGPESCGHLCCGRGHNTKIEKKVDRCQCKFIWCCEVKCKICETIEEKYYCK